MATENDQPTPDEIEAFLRALLDPTAFGAGCPDDIKEHARQLLDKLHINDL